MTLTSTVSCCRPMSHFHCPSLHCITVPLHRTVVPPPSHCVIVPVSLSLLSPDSLSTLTAPTRKSVDTTITIRATTDCALLHFQMTGLHTVAPGNQDILCLLDSYCSMFPSYCSPHPCVRSSLTRSGINQTTARARRYSLGSRRTSCRNWIKWFRRSCQTQSMCRNRGGH